MYVDTSATWGIGCTRAGVQGEQLMKCPHCGHTWSASSKPKSIAQPSDTATLTVEQLYAHYKKTAHIEDVRFFVGATADKAIGNQAIVLLAEAEHGLNRAETLRRLTRLQQSWRERERPPADERRFWMQIRQLGKRSRGLTYRQARDRVLSHLRDAAGGVRSTYYRPTPMWSASETIDGMLDQVIDEVRDLMRAARAICPAIEPAPGEPTGHVYTFGPDYPSITEVA